MWASPVEGDGAEDWCGLEGESLFTLFLRLIVRSGVDSTLLNRDFNFLGLLTYLKPLPLVPYLLYLRWELRLVEVESDEATE